MDTYTATFPNGTSEAIVRSMYTVVEFTEGTPPTAIVKLTKAQYLMAPPGIKFRPKV
jgi:hypothetical protein